MGDDLSLRERDSVRTPMQWSSAANAGFSTAPRASLVLPTVARGDFSYRQVNVADQHRDPSSLLHYVRRAVRARRELRELGVGAWEAVRVRDPSVLALRYHVNGSELLAVHNLAKEPVRARGLEADGLVDAFANRDYPAPGRSIDLDGYGFRWLRPRDAA